MPPFLTSFFLIQMCQLSPLLVRQGSLTPRYTSWLKGILTARFLHTHALFKVNNGTVFNLVQSFTRGNNFAPTIAPFRKTQNGCGAMLAFKSQHAGKAIWDRLVKEAEHTLSNKVWSGNTTTTLAQHMGMHCHAWIILTECAKHIPVDVPNDHVRVTYIMDLLKTVDPTVLAAIAAVRQDEADKCVNFENMFAYLVPVCPVTAKTAKKTEKGSLQCKCVGYLSQNTGRPRRWQCKHWRKFHRCCPPLPLPQRVSCSQQRAERWTLWVDKGQRREESWW